MSASDVVIKGKGRRQLVLIIALFLVPPVAAWLAWNYLGDQGVSATTNAGVLISPPRPLELQGLHQNDGAIVGNDVIRGSWTYVMFGDAGCTAECEQQLYLTRQTRLAMNKDIKRVQRVLILAEPPAAPLAEQLANEHADLRWLVRNDAAAKWLESFRGPGYGAGGDHYFLVDPLGNLMMVYDGQVSPKGLMKDLQKLLKISQIG